jgi:hypothetical protein
VLRDARPTPHPPPAGKKKRRGKRKGDVDVAVGRERRKKERNEALGSDPTTRAKTELDVGLICFGFLVLVFPFFFSLPFLSSTVRLVFGADLGRRGVVDKMYG